MMFDEDLNAYEKAENELKRIDHLIYVSLKYTRTVDVMRNIVERMLNAFNFIFEDLLARAEKEGAIFEIPAAPKLQCNILKKLYGDDEKFLEYIEFYLLLRRFKNAEYTARQEFRRYVTMTATFANGDVRTLDIDTITDYYHTMKEFVSYAKERFDESSESE
ncbi:MAG: hypothetical protein ACOCWQ_01495 [Nanoarchaeota archaeon]